MKEPSFPLDEIHKAELRRVFKQGGNISKEEGDQLIELRKTHTLKQTSDISGRYYSSICRYINRRKNAS